MTPGRTDQSAPDEGPRPSPMTRETETSRRIERVMIRLDSLADEVGKHHAETRGELKENRESIGAIRERIVALETKMPINAGESLARIEGSIATLDKELQLKIALSEKAITKTITDLKLDTKLANLKFWMVTTALAALAGAAGLAISVYKLVYP